MSPYILVSLWAEDDDATMISHVFALALHGRRPAAHLVHGEAPPHEALRRAAEACDGAPVVLFAHGGPALSARRRGPPWIDAVQLAQILSGRRVYAFACSTFVPQPGLLFGTFAHRVVEACVDVFVGHEAPIMAPLVRESHVARRMEDALIHLIERFIGGEDDENALVNVGRMYASWDLPIEIDLPSDDPQREGAFGWSSAAFLGVFFKSLRVLTKPRGAAHQGAQ